MKNIVLTVITGVFAVTSFFLGSALVLLLVLFGMQKRTAFVKVSRPWARAVLRAGGIKLKVSGQDNLNVSGPLIIVSNHQGNFDIPILLASLPIDFRFLVKKELFKVPFFGWYIRNRGDILIDREKGQKALRTLRATAELVRKGNPVLIFPEGTRSSDGSLGDFKRGSLIIAREAGAKVVPVGISGSYDIQKKGGFLINPAEVFVNIGRPMDIAEAAEVRAAVFSLMGSGQR